MTCFSWLHLTDLHRGMKEQGWLWPGVREIFFEDLKKLHDKCGPWDLVLFTGDLTQRGSAEEFQKVDEILKQLWEYLEKLGSSPKLLAVPGNHDLVRPSTKDASVKLLQQWPGQPDIQEEFWDDPESSYRQVVTKAFKNYSMWWEKQPFKAKNVNVGILPGDFSATIEKEGAKLGIVGFNTSFLQLTGDDHEGKLALHARQFHEACDGDGPAWAKQHHTCLLLTHHPPAWLNADAQQYLNGEVTAYSRFAVHLCGHMHETAVREIAEDFTEARRIWQGHSLFGLKYFGKESEGQRLHGYTAGKIELSENKGTLLFWPREAHLQGGQRKIVPDYSLNLTDEQYTPPKEFDLLQPYIIEEKPLSDEPTSYVQLIVEGQIEEFEKKCHELVNDIAMLLNIDRQSIRILHVDSGSIRAIIELPTDCAMELAALFNTRSERLDQLPSQFFIKDIKMLKAEELFQLLPKILIPHFIEEQYLKGNYEGNFDALTMFVDVSGFTEMTQTLMEKDREGAEALAKVMNGIFDKLVETVYEWGGFVATFAGDAFTAIFSLDNEGSAETTVRHVLACVDKLQAIFHNQAIQATPHGQVALQFKMGLSQGNVDWGILGNVQNTYFFRGDAIKGCAAAEKSAKKGDIILDERLAQFMSTVPCFAERILDVSVVKKGFYRLDGIPREILQGIQLPPLTHEPLNQDVLVHFLPDPVINFKGMGEFRQIIPIFIAFDGISTYKELNDWAVVLNKHIKEFGGHFNHLDFGDKGNLVLCAFGAPVAYEDMFDHALDFILAVQKDLQASHTLSKLRWKAGMTHGTAFTGIVGGTQRCEYTYYGEVVNLAARLMSTADWGEIFVSEPVYQRTLAVFKFESKGECSYKGFAEPIFTYMLLGRKLRLVSDKLETTMIGRQTELQKLHTFAAPIFKSKFAGIAYIHGEPGIGKSRLAFALEETLSQQKITWFRCRADQIVRKPLNPFISCLMQYFKQVSEDTESQKKRRFSGKYRALIERCQRIESEAAKACVKELERTKSIIGAQMGLFWKDSLWEDLELDAKGKYNNTINAIKTGSLHFFKMLVEFLYFRG